MLGEGREWGLGLLIGARTVPVVVWQVLGELGEGVGSGFTNWCQDCSCGSVAGVG